MERKSLIGMVIEALVLLLILSVVWGYYNRELNHSEQNLIASKNEVNELKLKNGDLLYERDSYILKVKELEDEIGVSKDEIKDLKKKLDSSIAYISKIESEYKVDTVYSVRDSIIYIDKNDVVAKFSYKDKWFSLNGENFISFNDNIIDDIKTNLYDINMSANLTVGLTDNYKFFITTDNPYISINNVDGAAIENSILVPKKKRFNFGIQLGMGINYDLLTKNLGIGPYGGFGLQYNF